jgi:UDPglucose 6-dehydrogenase
MNIGIIGQGFVGSAVREGLNRFYEVKTYDIDPSKCTDTHTDVCSWADIIFVCVPTPMRQSGQCDTRILEGVVVKINQEMKASRRKNKPILVIKSTVSPGTTADLDCIAEMCPVVFSPEFLTEANSFEDFKNQTRIIIGGNKNYHFAHAKKVKQMFRKPFPSIPIIIAEWKTAEMVKYFTNCFLATKVTFANQMYEICDEAGIDYDKVCEYALYDERIGKTHWSVPGPDGDRGFGGHCFPKDLAAMISFGRSRGVNCDMLRSIDFANELYRTNKDWEKMKGRAVSDD